MRTRSLGKTGIKLSELSLGTWGLASGAYGPVGLSQFVRTLSAAYDKGIRSFDMAPLWGEGESESTVAMAVGPRRSEVVYVTRAGRRMEKDKTLSDFSVKQLRKDCEKSLERLQTDYIDVWLLHNPPESGYDKDEVAALAGKLKEEGKIKSFGVSIGSVTAGRDALQMGAEVICYVHHLLNPSIWNALGTVFKEKECGLLVRSVLAHGLLCGHWGSTKSFVKGDHRAERWKADTFAVRLRQLSNFRFLLEASLRSMSHAAFRYALSEAQVSSLLLGAKNPAQIDEALAALEEQSALSETLKNRIAEVQRGVWISSAGDIASNEPATVAREQ
ncbi:MAG: aldo/keto reductase [Myxococcales bacterium]|nr:MAG: aldo/keto reductase [Myxococcales bacterium]